MVASVRLLLVSLVERLLVRVFWVWLVLFAFDAFVMSICGYLWWGYVTHLVIWDAVLASVASAGALCVLVLNVPLWRALFTGNG